MRQHVPADAPDLTGQVAVVTGGGRGLGRAFATALAAAGAAVAVVARSADELDGTAALVHTAGARALALRADVTDRAAVDAVAREVERSLGPADLLVNNAGVGGPFGPTWEVDAYVAGKTALTRLTEVLAAELDGAGVSVFAIEPGTVRTGMTERALGSAEGRRWLPWFRAIFDRGLDVTPEHAAELVLYLASGRADALTGRFVSRADDRRRLAGRAAEIARRDLYTLRLRTLDTEDP